MRRAEEVINIKSIEEQQLDIKEASGDLLVAENKGFRKKGTSTKGGDQEDKLDQDTTVKFEKCNEKSHSSRPKLVKGFSSKKIVTGISSKFDSVFSKENIKTWEELQNIENRRRDILRRQDKSFFRMLFFWEGTVLRALCVEPFFLLILTIYALIRLAARYELFAQALADGLGDLDLSVIGGFLTVTLIFYVKEIFSRFWSSYAQSMTIEGAIFEAATLAKNHLPKIHAHRFVRYVNAMHVAGYIGLSDAYDFTVYFHEANKMYRILTDEETDRLDKIGVNGGGGAYREILVWCGNEIATAQGKGFIDTMVAKDMRERIMTIRSKLGKLYDYDDQPVPFFYVHFLGILIVMYLPLFSMQMAVNAGIHPEDISWSKDVIFGLVVALQASFVIGLRLLARKLSNPFGSDVEHLSVMHYINVSWLGSIRILAAEVPDHIEEDVEVKLRNDQKNIGNAWQKWRRTSMATRKSNQNLRRSRTSAFLFRHRASSATDSTRRLSYFRNLSGSSSSSNSSDSEKRTSHFRNLFQSSGRPYSASETA